MKPDSLNSTFAKNIRTTLLQCDLSYFSKRNSHALSKHYFLSEFMSCDKVWLLVDRIRKPLEAAYTGSYKVL